MSRTWFHTLLLLGSSTVFLAACSGGSIGRDPCEGRQCGTAEGQACGTCSLATAACSDAGLCLDRCTGRQCGPVEGGDCGACTGATEVCDDESGQCVDVCVDRECGEPVPGISCGQCTPPERCGQPGRCFVPGGCPVGMIEVGLTGVCIDAYEMTWTQWAEFLNAHGSNDCRIEGFRDWDDLYQCYAEGAVGAYVARESEGPWQVEPAYEQHAAAWVTYVGARLACEHWGKQLCGIEERAQACEGPEGNIYPYGGTYEPFTCNACNHSYTPECSLDYLPAPVGSFPGCEGGYPGLFDMSGNVAEWALDFELTPFGGVYTYLGGNAGSGDSAATCRFTFGSANSPYGTYPLVGFRCCYHLD